MTEQTSDWKDSGYSLKFYHDEKEQFKEAYAMKLGYAETEIVFLKLKRHYKLRGWLDRTDRVSGGRCSSNGRVQVRHSTDFGVLCHEMAHLYEFTKYRESRHGKRLNRIMARMVGFCSKRGYWKGELERRLAPKPVVVPTESDVKMAKIAKRKADLARYEKTLAYWTKLYTGKIKKAKKSIAMMERHKPLDKLGQNL